MKDTMMNQQTLNEGTTRAVLGKIPKGEYFRLKDSPTAKVYRKEAYCRSERKYQVTDCADIWGAGRMLKSTTTVIVGFTY